ncbi:hypothetical protein IE53DRAFT_247185 [Violaceomyces palustris]|uniref:Uncharacterized protein n=1 Tax=Violaceomyces palustris TaxID=1673888 RepID=A0ACD0NNU5_9BASI|nr:hypothetical protein IE53DRAFT_247185 [Violaceomyces palustris]
MEVGVANLHLPSRSIRLTPTPPLPPSLEIDVSALTTPSHPISNTPSSRSTPGRCDFALLVVQRSRPFPPPSFILVPGSNS